MSNPDETEDPRRFAPSFTRNKDPILTVLRGVLPEDGLILEIASGSGEHAAHAAPQLRPRRWQPTDIDPEALKGIDAHARIADERGEVILPAQLLDTGQGDWPVTEVAAMVCINMIHIAPWSATEGLMRGAGRYLRRDGVLFLYGPYKKDGAHTAPSNENFDLWLRQRDESWGVRDLESVTAEAEANGLMLDSIEQMPANNFSVIFKRRS